MEAIFFPKGGHIVLRKFTGSALGNPVNSVARVQSVAPGVTQNSSEIPDGNSDWAFKFDTTKAGNVVVTMVNFCPDLYAALVGDTPAVGSADMWAAHEYLIGDGGTYTTTVPHTPKGGGQFIVLGADGSPYVSGSGTGKYTLAGSTLTFASADDGKPVVIRYEHTASGATTAGLAASGVRPMLQAVVMGEATDDDGATYDANIVIDRCKATGEIALPTWQKEPATWQFTLDVQKPRGSTRAVKATFKKRA